MGPGGCDSPWTLRRPVKPRSSSASGTSAAATAARPCLSRSSSSAARAPMGLGDWSEREGLASYSGGVLYRTRFAWPAEEEAGAAAIDLGARGLIGRAVPEREARGRPRRAALALRGRAPCPVGRESPRSPGLQHLGQPLWDDPHALPGKPGFGLVGPGEADRGPLIPSRRQAPRRSKKRRRHESARIPGQRIDRFIGAGPARRSHGRTGADRRG